jgi:hypothetical protein
VRIDLVEGDRWRWRRLRGGNSGNVISPIVNATARVLVMLSASNNGRMVLSHQ